MMAKEGYTPLGHNELVQYDDIFVHQLQPNATAPISSYSIGKEANNWSETTWYPYRKGTRPRGLVMNPHFSQPLTLP